LNDNSIPPLGETLYCPGCNQCFRLLTAFGSCPRCGAAVESRPQSELDETLLYKDAGVPPSKAERHASRATELAGLLGSELHVYRCDSLIGSGGMGHVFQAFHQELQRKCALKVLSPRLAARDAEYVSRFQNEGRAAAALVHPNIVTTHAIGRKNEYHFLEMELVAGRSLQHVLDDEGRLTPIRATEIAARIGEALGAAHREGILHRDLKPDNVLLTHQGIPKLVDFGLAKRIHGSASSSEGLAGTPNFMSPELFHGDAASPASDVYALGVCYFLMLTGRLPFVGSSLSELQQAVSHDRLPNARDAFGDIPLEMAECVAALLDRSPGNRPRSGMEAAEYLNAICGQVRAIESLLAEAFEGLNTVSWKRSGEKYRLTLQLSNGRRQTLFVEPSEHAVAERLLLISSVCCKAEPSYYENALRLNSEILHGALAIREVDGVPMFVVVDTYPRTTVDAEEVRRSVVEVAQRADAVEHMLTGRDVN
jgi:serine/threonine-protein kinase